MNKIALLVAFMLGIGVGSTATSVYVEPDRGLESDLLAMGLSLEACEKRCPRTTPPPTATEYIPEPCPTVVYHGLPDGEGVITELDNAIFYLDQAYMILDKMLTSTEGTYDWRVSSSMAHINNAAYEMGFAIRQVEGWQKTGQLTCPGEWPVSQGRIDYAVDMIYLAGEVYLAFHGGETCKDDKCIALHNYLEQALGALE